MPESLPIILTETRTADGDVRLILSVPAELNLFAGHFPGFPLLPGVAQIHWAACLGAERFAIDSGFSRLLNIKFQKPLLPDSELELLLKWDADRWQLSFTYDSAAGCHASGKIEYAAANLDGSA